MELITWFIDFILHLDKHLTELVADYHLWIYAILFLIIFCETGLVVTPFLPGDSLLFAVGALAAVDQTGTLNATLVWLLLMVAAILGNEVNFRIGRAIGPRAFSGSFRWLKQEYLIRTQAVLREARRQDDHPVALRSDHPHLRAVRGRRRADAAPPLRRLQLRRRLRLGARCSSGAATCSATCRSSRRTSAS